MQLQLAPPTGAWERNQERRGPVDAGGGPQARAGVHAPLVQAQSLLLPGEILQHARVMELHLLQRVSE